MNIIIAEDIQIVRNGLKIILEQSNQIKVLACAENGQKAYELCKEHAPDLVLMDFRMPECDGAEGTKLIKAFDPKIKVLILTTFDDDKTVEAALSSGADGYVLKEMDETTLIKAIQSTVSGINVLGGNIYKNLLSKVYLKEDSNMQLTEREKEILILIVKGCDNKTIANKLFLAVGTVRNNISNLLDKLHLEDRTQLAVYAIKNSLY
ncbi:MAG TPA: DNA-binding response regulator [Porphyromonadaceae bacterium]|nr:DNA-binding response regulator [Porphyromonadaceae bacterium]